MLNPPSPLTAEQYKKLIVAILLKHEDELSDGYKHYNELIPVDVKLNKIADEILSLLV